MRPIEFRAWDKKEKKYIGWACLRQTAFNTQSVHAQHNATEIYTALLYRVFTNPNYELEQWTGLTDKNKTKAYHQDIAKDEWGQIWTMEWDDKEACYYLLLKGYKPSDIEEYDECMMDARAIHDMEIIGSKNQNPELLCVPGPKDKSVDS